MNGVIATFKCKHLQWVGQSNLPFWDLLRQDSWFEMEGWSVWLDWQRSHVCRAVAACRR